MHLKYNELNIEHCPVPKQLDNNNQQTTQITILAGWKLILQLALVIA